MFNFSDIRDQIKKEFPDNFASKASLQEYYMSYEYPAQQHKTYELWKRLLVFVCVAERKLTFSRKYLSELLVFYGMKPLPLDAILRQLVKEGSVFQKSKYALVYGKEKQQKPQEGVGSKLWGYFFNSKVEAPLEDQYYFKSMMDDAIALSKKEIKNIFKNQTALLESVVIERLQSSLRLKADGDFLLNILLCQRLLLKISSAVDNINVTLIIYSDNPEKSLEKVAEQSKIEFCLHQWEKILTDKIDLKYGKLQQIFAKVKDCLKNSNKSMAKEYLKVAKLEEQSLSKLMLRKRILTKQINQIEESQSNLDMVKSLEQSQKLLKTMEVDMDRMVGISLDAEEIRRNRDDVQKIFEGMADNEGEEELFKTLEKEVEEDQMKKLKPISKMQVERPQQQQQQVAEQYNQQYA